MEKLCLRDCKIAGIPFLRGMIYDIEWNPISNCFFAHNVWGSVPLTDREYKNIFD